MPRLPFPPPRQLPWPLKPLDSAQTSLGYDNRARIPGIFPGMARSA